MPGTDVRILGSLYLAPKCGFFVSCGTFSGTFRGDTDDPWYSSGTHEKEVPHMSNRCSVCPVVPGLVALASAALFGLPVFAADYMLETPGESYTLTGEIVADTESMSVTKTVRVLERGAVKNVPGGAIVLHTAILVDGDIEERVLCLKRREDGFYRVATAKKPGGKARPEKDPQLEIPIPLEVGTSWTSVEKRKGKAEMTWTIVEIDPESGLAHVKGEGEAKVLWIEIPVVKESWILPTGVRTLEISRQTIMGKEAVITLEAATANNSEE